jgi:thiamine kinase-like enzyme
MIPWKDFPWEHPRARQRFPQTENNVFRRMLNEHELFLDKLDQLPLTVSHGDTYPTNFRSRRVYRGQEQTVAIDWALAGIAPMGDDLGQLVYGTCINLRGYKLQDISNLLITSYINGLQDSGCRIEPEIVRFGYVASAAFRVGLFKLSMMREDIEKW